MPFPTKNKTTNIAYLALSVTLIFLFSYIEMSLNFNFGVAGAKIGLSNTVIIITLYIFGVKYCTLLAVLKILISTFFINGFSSFLFTAMGSIASVVSMIIFKKIFRKNISAVGVSVVGGFFHITAQYITSSVLFSAWNVFKLYPFAVIITLVTSIIVGIISNLVIEQMKGSC